MTDHNATALADTGAAHGGNVWQGESPQNWLDFSANLRPEGTPEWARAAMERAMDEARYYPDSTLYEAKAGIAACAGVNAECVLPTAGGIAAIDAVCRADSGCVHIPAVTFGEYRRRALACGREVVCGDAEMTPGDALFLCNPNNPTGEATEKERVMALYARAKRAGGKLIVDEAFADWCPEISVKREAAESAGLIVLGSLTKTLCVPGVRLGYLIAAPKEIARLEKLSAPWSLNAFAVAIARELPKHLNEIAQDARINAERRRRFADALNGLGACVAPSRANFLLAEFDRPTGEIARALKGRGILVRDVKSFGLSDRYLRLAVKTDAENGRLIDELRGLLV